jgi:cation-transporting ATPase G
MIQNLALSGLLIATLIPVAALGLLGLGTVVARRTVHPHAVTPDPLDPTGSRPYLVPL